MMPRRQERAQTGRLAERFDSPEPMKVGIAADHGGFALKEELVAQLRAEGHEVVDFGPHTLRADDDYPDYVTPLAKGVVAEPGGARYRHLRQWRGGFEYSRTKLPGSAPPSFTTTSRPGRGWKTTI